MADASDREQVDAALALIDDVFATFLIPHDDADPMHAGWTRRASVRADVAQKWRDRRDALAARTPQPAEPTRHLVILSGLADEIDQHAAIAARPGQMGDLERIACAVRDVANELAPLPTVSDGEDETSRAVSRLMFDARPVDHAAEQVAVRTVDLARVLNEFIQYAAAGINKPRQEGP